MLSRRLFTFLLLTSAIGCVASAPRAAVPDLAGAWDFTVDLGSSVTPGSMTLVRSGTTWTGELRAAGPNALPVRSVTLTGRTVDLTVESPEGPVTFRGTLDTDGNRMQGEVTYHGGRRFPMVVTRRRASQGATYVAGALPQEGPRCITVQWS
jgi:hypothetical protein